MIFELSISVNDTLARSSSVTGISSNICKPRNAITSEIKTKNRKISNILGNAPKKDLVALLSCFEYPISFTRVNIMNTWSQQSRKSEDIIWVVNPAEYKISDDNNIAKET